MFIENLKMAIGSILANKMRSFLTMLGIIIGITAVISILAVGNGATAEITSTFSDLGANMINLTTSAEPDSESPINLDDLSVVKDSIDRVDRVSPDITLTGTANGSSDESRTLILSKGTPDLQYLNTAMESEILHGRYYSEQDIEAGNNVVVIDSDAATALFNRENAVGETLSINTPSGGSEELTVIGVTQGFFAETEGAFDEETMPVFASMPVSEDERIETAFIEVESTDDIDPVSNQVVRMLELRHDAVGDGIYNATNFLNAMDQINNVLGLFINFIAAVAAIALLVGGIGVMNIMLVSVTERTREIGTRKALGATTQNILMQFLLESVILSLIGGIIGLILGAIGSVLIANALGITPAIGIGSVLLVLTFSILVGVFFGIYPARKAAKLNPIDALRHE